MKIRSVSPTDLSTFVWSLGYCEPAYAMKGDRHHWFNAQFVPVRDRIYLKENGHYRFQRRSAGWNGTERRVWALCWHGYLKAFRAIFKAFPKAEIHIALAKQVHGNKPSESLYTVETFEKLFPKTGTVNIGSQLSPLRADEACFCSQMGDSYWRPFTKVEQKKVTFAKHYRATPKAASFPDSKTTRVTTDFGASSGPKVKSVKQKNLSSECWPVQVWGLSRCDECEVRDTEECRGKEIRETLKNSLGEEVPIS